MFIFHSYNSLNIHFYLVLYSKKYILLVYKMAPIWEYLIALFLSPFDVFID